LSSSSSAASYLITLKSVAAAAVHVVVAAAAAAAAAVVVVVVVVEVIFAYVFSVFRQLVYLDSLPGPHSVCLFHSSTWFLHVFWQQDLSTFLSVFETIIPWAKFIRRVFRFSCFLSSQGDQMSFVKKVAQNVDQHIFLQNQ
jgi:hypothetical protein